MKIIVCKDSKEGGLKAAEILRDVINEKNDAVLGLATGSTPIDMYKSLIKMYENKELTFKDVKSVNLDEYVGLSGEHDQSYRYFMNDNLFNHVDINKENTYVPNGLADDYDAEVKEYEERIDRLGGQDVQILGVGVNGHIGFNEPAEKLELYTHVEDLTQSTIDANSRNFASVDDVPKQAISMGLRSIFKAKKIVLMAFGENKADAIASLEYSKVSTLVPVSLLKLHDDVTVIVDEAAASKLSK